MFFVDHRRKAWPETIDLILQEADISSGSKGRHDKFFRMRRDDIQRTYTY
jgi:hypothetical protein